MESAEGEVFLDVSILLRSGIYLLVRKGVVVYVGQSAKLMARVNNHSTNRGRRQHKFLGRKVTGEVFDQVLVMACPVADLDRVETELIARYIPKYNTELKPRLVVSLDSIIAALVPTAQAQRTAPSFNRRA